MDSSVIEIWKQVEGGHYEVSNLGRVRSLVMWGGHGVGHIPRPEPVDVRVWKNRGGYLKVGMWKNSVRTTWQLGSLVLTAFVGPKPDGYECSHENGDKMDNRLCNLAWRTHQSNVDLKVAHGTHNHGTKNHNAKITENDVRIIRRLAMDGVRAREINKQFGFSDPRTISAIIRRASWKHV